MTILITGFDAFGGETTNPAWNAVQALPDAIDGVRIEKLRIPTVFADGPRRVIEAMEAAAPDYVLSIGQAGGRSAMTVEFVGINWQDGRIPDNAGIQPDGTLLEETGETAYFTTLPVRSMIAAMRQAGVPAFVSYTAGTFVCNAVLYRVLHRISTRDLKIKAGFIHVPYLPSQAVDKPPGTPVLDQDTIRRGIEAAIRGMLQPTGEAEVLSLGRTE